MTTVWDDEERKVDYFETRLKSGSTAEQWFKGLEAAKKATWKELCTVFKERWPERPLTQKSTAEKQAELEGEKITEAELGMKVKVNGAEVYAHIAWANQVEKLAKAIPDNNNLLVAEDNIEVLREDYDAAVIVRYLAEQNQGNGEGPSRI